MREMHVYNIGHALESCFLKFRLKFTFYVLSKFANKDSIFIYFYNELILTNV